MRIKRFILPVTLGLILAISGAAYLSKNVSSALSGSQFKAGKIISDSLFYTGSAMSTSQIQSFLNKRVPSCDTNGQKLIYDRTYNDTVTRKKYSQRRGVSTPFICLKNYSQSTSNVSANAQCSAYSGGTKSAARIINEVAKACKISQKALIVLLQKEQSLVTDDWPWPVQYKKATGYGCPDSGSCDSQYYYFFNQVYNAARQYNRYKQNPENYNHLPNRTNSVRYHPNSSCGTKSVKILNYATAGLYNYTPYTPNSAALNNLYGTGNNCSAYGNRNFWRLYNDWFGSTVNELKTSFLTGDFNGDGKDDLVRVVNNRIYIDFDRDGIADGSFKYPYPTRTIFSIDRNGDGRDSFAYVVKNRIYVDLNYDGIADGSFKYPYPTRTILAMDHNGDGKEGYVYVVDNRLFVDLNYDGIADGSFKYPYPAHTILPADWNGDGKDSFGYVVDNRLFIDLNYDGYVDGSFKYGNSSDRFVSGDWNGNGKESIGVKRYYEMYLDGNSDGNSDMNFYLYF